MALRYKRESCKSQAKQMLVISKSLQSIIDNLEANIDVSENFEFVGSPVFNPMYEPKPDPISTESIKDIQIPEKQKISKVTKPNKDTHKVKPSDFHIKQPLDIIKSRLSSQIETCTKTAAYYYKLNQKDLALEFHKLKKTIQTDYELLVDSPSIPPFINKLVKYEYEMSFPLIQLEEIEVSIIEIWDIDQMFEANSTFSVHVDLTGLNQLITPQIVKSNQMKSTNGLISYLATLKIVRGKSLQRFLERSKIVVTLNSVVESGSILGWFTGAQKSVVIGKTTVKLAALLNESEVHSVFELFDPLNSRRLIPPKIELAFRLKIPLLSKHIVKKEEQWIMINHNYNSELNSNIVVDQDEIKSPLLNSELELPTTISPKRDSIIQTSNKTSKSSDISKAKSPTKISTEPSPALSIPEVNTDLSDVLEDYTIEFEK